MKRKDTWLSVPVAALLLAASFPAVALTTYTWGTRYCPTSSTNTTCTDAAAGAQPAVTFSAISDTGGTGTIATPGPKLLAEAYLVNYDTTVTGGHLGVTSEAGVNAAANAGLNAAGATETTQSPQHAMDNYGNSEFILLNFGASAVSLSQVTLGWTQSDSDITVLAYTGCLSGQTCSPTLIGDRYNNLVGNTTGTGWSAIGNYMNVGVGSATISTTVSSSYWLIGAYNNLGGSNYNANGSAFTGTPDATPDYVKLLSVAGCVAGAGCSKTTQNAPEPSSLFLAAIALLGLMELRRRAVI